MAPSSDVCLKCQGSFVGKQKFLNCTDCGYRAHIGCLLPKLRKQRSFLCDSCKEARKTSTSTQTDSAGSNTGVEDTPLTLRSQVNPAEIIDALNEFLRPQSLTRDSDSTLDRLVSMVTCICQDLKQVQSKVSTLELQNIALKNEIQSLRSLSPSGDFPSEISRSYSSVIASLPNSPPAGLLGEPFISRKKESDRPSSILNPRMKPYVQNVGKSASSAKSASPSVVGTLGNRSVPIKGTNVATGIKAVSRAHPVRPRRKAIFVSRLDPTLSSEVLSSFLANENGLASVRCVRLKTRYPDYASFHVTADDKEFDILLQSNVWPKDSIVCPFRGFLRDDKKHDSERVQSNQYSTDMVVNTISDSQGRKHDSERVPSNQYPTEVVVDTIDDYPDRVSVNASDH